MEAKGLLWVPPKSRACSITPVSAMKSDCSLVQDAEISYIAINEWYGKSPFRQNSIKNLILVNFKTL